MGTVWSIVCAMNIGIIPESSLKDVSFVNFNDVVVRNQHPGEQEASDREDVESKPAAGGGGNVSAAFWPFLRTVRNTMALKKPVRKRGRRKRVRWTIKRQKKPREAALSILERRRVNDGLKSTLKRRAASSLVQKLQNAESRGASDGPAAGYNLPRRQLHARLSSGARADDVRDKSAREATHQVARTTERSASTRLGLHSLSHDAKKSMRGCAKLSSLTDYYRNMVRVNDDMGDIWEKTSSSSQNDDDDDDGDDDDDDDEDYDGGAGDAAARFPGRSTARKSDLARRRASRRGSPDSYEDGGRLPRRRRKRKQLLGGRKERSAILKNGAVVSRQARSVAARRRKADLVEGARKHCSKCNKRRRRFYRGTPCSCQIDFKDTATAIMKDIHEHIKKENTEWDKENSEAAETRDDDVDRVSVKYEWEDEDDKDNSRRSEAKSFLKAYSSRKPYRKRRTYNTSIDCEFVDLTETTYQSVLPNRDDAAPSTQSLKIHVDEVNVSDEESKVVVEAPQERNALMANAYYVYHETPDNIVKEEGVVARGPRTRFPRTPIDRLNVTKDVVTYGKRSKGNGRSSLTSDHSFGREKERSQDPAKVQVKSEINNSKDESEDFENNKKYVLRSRSTRSSGNPAEKSKIGRLVWGNCSGWWPALIVEADQIGMTHEAGKEWVYWIGESQISQLNEKTQIEPFSRKLEERLAQKFRKINTRSQAIDETIKMLRQRFECTLTKPYYYWIRRNISTEELDNLCFYPYPSKIQERMEDLKEKNAKATERYILQQRSDSPDPKKQAIDKTKETKVVKQMEEERLQLRGQLPGVITWAKIAGHNWWPAMIIDYRDCCLKEPGFGCQWIMWYGDYTVSQVHHLAFLKFHKGIEKMREYVENTKKHVYLMGVLQASKDYCSRLGCNTDNWSLDNVFKYFSDMNNIQEPYNHLQVSESNKVYDKYSNEIIQKINELKSSTNVDSKRKSEIQESDALRRVMQQPSKLETLCLKCLQCFPKNIMEEHPFFEGSLCEECSNLFKPCMFVFGNDDKCFALRPEPWSSAIERIVRVSIALPA